MAFGNFFQDRCVRFDCIHDVLRHRYCTFREASKVVDMLLRADELISFNGKCWDFVMLEKQVEGAAGTNLDAGRSVTG
jgi:hypothetical protein